MCCVNLCNSGKSDDIGCVTAAADAVIGAAVVDTAPMQLWLVVSQLTQSLELRCSRLAMGFGWGGGGGGGSFQI